MLIIFDNKWFSAGGVAKGKERGGFDGNDDDDGDQKALKGSSTKNFSIA